MDTPLAWSPRQRRGDHAKAVETMPKARRPRQRRGDHAKGMETTPKAWRPRQRRGDQAKGVETTPKAWRPRQRRETKARRLLQIPDFRHDGTVWQDIVNLCYRHNISKYRPYSNILEAVEAA